MSFRAAILYASVGTGHRTAALALEKWFRLEIPDSEVLCLDTLSFSSPIVRGVYTRSYLEMVRHIPQLWGYFYDTTDEPRARDGVIATLGELTEKLNIAKLRRMLEDFSPDAIVFTHFFGANSIAEEFAPRIPVYYVNTDFLSHVFHRNPAFSGWFVSTEETVSQHIADGLPAERVFLTGIPVDPLFTSPLKKSEARKSLGIAPDEMVALVMGGGIGMGSMAAVVHSLFAGKFSVDALCGTSEKIHKSLSEEYKGCSSVWVHGFTGDIPLRFAAADVIFMKPGGLSSSEALCTGTPMVITDPIPGQEQRNSDFLLERGAVRVLFDYRLAAEKARWILSSKTEAARMKRAARSIAKPFAGRDIVRKIRELKDQ
ncbi:MAG: galactosyldiacylglycerol synthase [Thermovirgaceae bacterium]|nr:galactosyldiacylglycerol synthase [Thermovirgaceae bacterium]